MELFFHTFRLTVNLPIPVYAHMQTLKRTIDQLNEKLQEINSGYSSSSSIKPPNIGLDLIKSSKSKNEAKVAFRWYPSRKGAFKTLAIQTVKIKKQT